MPTYYDVDLRRAKLRELLSFDMPWYLRPLVVLLKLLGVRLLGSADDPPVEALAPFEVDEADLPEDIRTRFEPLLRDLAGLGFGNPIVHSIPDPLHATRSYWTTRLHSSGQAWARIHCRIWSGQGTDRVFLFPMFFTEFDDGSFLITSAGKADFTMPVGTRMVNQVGADCPALWERHSVEREHDFRLTPRRIANPDGLRAAMERLHGRIRDYLLDRGIFQPLGDAEQQRLQDAVPAAEALSASAQDDAGQDPSPAPPVQEVPPLSAASAAPVDGEEAAVLVELERLQNKQASLANTLLILAVSLLLFMGAWRMGQGVELLWTIIPILAFHELGHYLAMRRFGYRNVRMFFIPFLGAAVSGQNYNVPGWKKALVALAGPVPGIIVGGLIGALGLVFEEPWLVHTALFMVIINGFNLLPLLPLDGGWVLHAVLFVRHPVLDVVFRALAILGLFGLGLLADDKVLLILPALMLLSLPVAWRIAQVAYRIRQQGVATVSSDAQTIPTETARTILRALRAAAPRQRIPSMLAMQVVQVFETINARPPGVLASIGLLAVHAGSFVAALIVTVILVIGPVWLARNRANGPPMAQKPPAHSYERGQTALWRGPDAPARPTNSASTLIATCADAAAAKEAFDNLQKEVPRNAILRWFGQDVLLILPTDQQKERDLWLHRLQRLDANAAARGPGESFIVRLACPVPPGPAGKDLEGDLHDYIEAPNIELLIPPWSQMWALLDVERFRKARRTLRRLHGLQGEAARDIKFDPPRGGLFGPNQEQLLEHARAVSEAMKAEEQRLLEQIRAEGDDTVDRPMITLWERFRKLTAEGGLPAKDKARAAEFWRQRNALLQQMAQRMGRLPLQGERPKPGSDLSAVRFGGLSKQNDTLNLFLTFSHAHEGLPALADWITQRGDVQLRYEFLKGTTPDDEEEP